MDIETVPTDCLLAEIQKRGDATVLLQIRPEKVGKDGQFVFIYDGGFTLAMGMLARAMASMNKEGAELSEHQT